MSTRENRSSLCLNRTVLQIWQLNENWPTGGWGSIEYGTPTVAGQVIGGRWKPLMHMFQNSILRDVFAACGRGNRCFVKNDGMEAVDIQVKLEYWVLSEQKPMHEWTHSVSLKGGVAATGEYHTRFSSPIACII